MLCSCNAMLLNMLDISVLLMQVITAVWCQDCTELREQGATLNPKTFPPSQADAPAPVSTSADAPAPAAKTRADMMQYARVSDLGWAADVKHSNSRHPQKRTGVHASHAFQKGAWLGQ